MHEYNKKTIDEIIWVVYKTSQEGTMFHYKDDEHAQEHITNFLKEIDNNHKEFHLNNDIYNRTRMIEYIQSKEKLFI